MASDLSGIGDLRSIVRRQATYTMRGGTNKGIKIELQALGLQDIARCQDEALAEHRRGFIETYTRNIDLIPEADRRQVVDSAFAKASRMTLADLPDPELNVPIRNDDGSYLTDDLGSPVYRRESVEHVFWWMSETLRGRLFAVWLSARKSSPELTLDYLDLLFIDSPQDLRAIAQTVADLTTPKLGNESRPVSESAPAETRPETPRERRLRIKQERTRTATLGTTGPS
jgi:hypothetical protein